MREDIGGEGQEARVGLLKYAEAERLQLSRFGQYLLQNGRFNSRFVGGFLPSVDGDINTVRM